MATIPQSAAAAAATATAAGAAAIPARRSTTGAWSAVVKNTRASEWAGLAGKLVGVGLFATLMYNYCNILLEACIRGIH